MPEPTRPTKLQRILNLRLFGKPRQLPAERAFEELSHSEQQAAMLWGERGVAGVPIAIGATTLTTILYVIGFIIGIALARSLDVVGPLISQTFGGEDRTLMIQLVVAYITCIAVLALLVLYSSLPARWLVGRWPRKFADTQDPAAHIQLKRVSNAIIKYGFVLILMSLLLGAYIDGWTTVLYSLSFLAPILLLIWFIYRGASRSGIEPCCRKCGYSLPLSEPLPERCSECGVELTEPWGRVLGRSRRQGLWWVYFGLLMLMPIAVGAASWVIRA